MSAVPRCRIATVHTYQGDRTSAFRRRIYGVLDDERNGRAPGPSGLDCLLLTGHTGVSTGRRGEELSLADQCQKGISSSPRGGGAGWGGGAGSGGGSGSGDASGAGGGPSSSR